ncbi:MAG: hypothetical protein LBV32_00365 [Tannerellaceae bacterium]|jgi:hypothetical protein|nr:hypothetical protein [Tannerellaceae bacterium]
MKLKNIVMAFGVLLAFSACSNDNETLKEEGTAFLSIKVATNTRTDKKVQTKADPLALPGEDNINTLTAFVFSTATQEFIGGRTDIANAVETYEMSAIEVQVESQQTAMIVLVSNAPAAAMQGITNYGQLQSVLAQLADQQQNSLTMSTQLITTVSPLLEGDNYIGFGEEQTNVDGINSPLWLTRLPARLQVVGAETRFDLEARPELQGRTVRVNSISFTNVKTDSHYFSEGDWGIVQSADGALSSTAEVAFDDVLLSTANTRVGLNYFTYVMENLGEGNTAPTSILVTATLSATDEYESETVSFIAPINTLGVNYTSGDGIDVSHRYVKRNFAYNISLVFQGEAFEGTITEPDIPPPPPPIVPDPTLFDVAVSVVGWGVVNQPTEPE